MLRQPVADQSTGSVCNARNASCNAQYKVSEFLESRPIGDEQWCPKKIAKALDIPDGTVRSALKRLKDKGKVAWFPKGIIHLYASTKKTSDDFNRLFKVHGTGKRYEIHGLTLKLEAKNTGVEDFTEFMCNRVPGGGQTLVSNAVVLDSFGVKDKGQTSFQLWRSTLMVYCGCSLKPMDYDGFLLWLARVDGWLNCRKWPSIEANLNRWMVVQYGLNDDHKVFRNDSPTRACSIKGFESWFARVYEKEGRGLRNEIHGTDEKSLEEFVMLASGSMTSVQVMQYLQMVVQSLNTSQAWNQEIAKKVGKLTDKNSERDKVLADVVSIVSDLFSEVKKLKKARS